MKIFLDTNILLDIFLHRDGGEASTKIVNLCFQDNNTGWIAWHTLTNGYYMVHRETQSPDEADRFLKDLIVWAHIAPTSTHIVSDALDMKVRDREDALQIASAIACDADVIITRNTRDFAGSPIPYMSPEEFLENK